MAIPRGDAPTGIVATRRCVASLTILTVHEHQLVAITYLSLGVTATYFGTMPTSATPTIESDFVLTSYRKLGVSPASRADCGVHVSDPSGPEPVPYIE